MKRFRRLLSRLLVEALLIAVSVLLALAVNNWKARRDNSARAVEARDAFLTALQANRAMLASEAVLPHHQKLQAIYAKAMAARAPDPKALFETGLHPATFGDAAWRSFSTSTIFSDFTVKEVLMLSDLYHTQLNIERRAESLVLALTSPRSDRETAEYQRDSTISITLFLNDLIPAEQNLLRQYDQAIRELQIRR